jgi:hypothetical protein
MVFLRNGSDYKNPRNISETYLFIQKAIRQQWISFSNAMDSRTRRAEPQSEASTLTLPLAQ